MRYKTNAGNKMKTTIEITGQISGNFTLRNAISRTGWPEIHKGMFNAFRLTFETRKEARKALWEAYKSLREDKQDARASMLKYTPKYSLSYDASRAVIID